MGALPFPPRRTRPPARQRGVVLVVGLIMLLLVTLIAVAAIRMATTHVQVVGNEQFKAEAAVAANYALDLVLNDPQFTDRALSATPVDVNVAAGADSGHGVTLQASYTDAQCSRYRYIKKQELVRKVEAESGGYTYTVGPNDVGCISGQSSTGITLVNDAASGNPEDNSLCVTTLWDVAATVEDETTGASVKVNQGIEMRMEMTEAENKCEP